MRELGSESGEEAAPLDLAALKTEYLYARRAQPNIQHKKIYRLHQKNACQVEATLRRSVSSSFAVFFAAELNPSHTRISSIHVATHGQSLVR